MRSTSRRGGRSRSQATGLFRSSTGIRLEAVERRVLLSSYAITTDITLGPPVPRAPVVRDAAGDLFTTSTHGGANGRGAVYEIAHDTTLIATLASFDRATGASPNGVTLDAAGNLFGTTQTGGPQDYGTVFEVAAGSSVITTLASFTFKRDEGAWPYAPVTLDAAGNIFGTTFQGGINRNGTVWELPAGSSAITTVALFNGTNGRNPQSAVTLDPAGNIFGTTTKGGPGEDGTVFEIARGSAGAGTNAVTTLATFSLSTGYQPTGNVAIDAAGNLFGANWTGGPTNGGTLYEVPAGGRAATVLAGFTAASGYRVNGVTLDPAGNLFGTTLYGPDPGPSVGAVFELPRGANTITALAAFNGANGANPYAGITLDPAGNLYGTTSAGGANNVGTVFEVARPSGSSSGAITTLASFAGSTTGALTGGVTADAAGNLFGTTQFGGASDFGIAFEVAAGTNTLTTLASFLPGPANTHYDHGPLTLDAAGNLFGTDFYGGPAGKGSVYEIAKGTNTITTLAAFDGTNGGSPSAGVTLDSAGDLFGAAGDANNNTIVYELPHGSGVIATVATFTAANGIGSFTPVLDAAGNLYGATRSGGANNGGTVYEIAAGSRLVTTLASFNAPGSDDPYAGVTADAAGDVFGATYNGGAFGSGQVYEIAHGSGVLTTLFSFLQTSGEHPGGAPLALDSAGNLFGATTSGGAYGDGTVFEIPHATTSGGAGGSTLTTLFAFNGDDGGSPGGVAPDVAGRIYGTTSPGPGGGGTIFGLSPGATDTVLSAPAPVSTTYYAPTTFTARLTSAADGSALPGRVVGFLAFNGPRWVLLGTALTDATGTATLPGVAFIDPGNWTYAAAFGGDSTYGISRSADGSLTVAQSPTSTALTASAGAASAGQKVTFTATVTPAAADGGATPAGATPAGNVTFYDNGATLGTAFTDALGTATFTTSSLPAGSHSITASYTGGTDFKDSLAGPLTLTVDPGPLVVSVTPQDSGGNGAAAGAAAGPGGGQRSLVTRLAVNFSVPTKLGAGAFSLDLLNQYGSGKNDGSADTDVSSVLGSPVNPSGDGMNWIVPIVQNGTSTTYSYNLGAAGGGGGGAAASLQDGVYRLSVNPAAVTSSRTGAAMSSAYASPLFHRLYGDSDGNKTANALDYARFKNAFGSSTGAAAYNADLDFDANGTVNAADYAQFKKRFGLTFAYP